MRARLPEYPRLHGRKSTADPHDILKAGRRGHAEVLEHPSQKALQWICWVRPDGGRHLPPPIAKKRVVGGQAGRDGPPPGGSLEMKAPGKEMPEMRTPGDGMPGR